MNPVKAQDSRTGGEEEAREEGRRVGGGRGLETSQGIVFRPGSNREAPGRF